MNLGDAEKLPEHRIRCGLDGESGADADQLFLQIDGAGRAVKLRIHQLSAKLVAELPNVATDLIEIAAYVYAADAAISRGGPKDENMGANWRRNFVFEIPVRRPDIWSAQDTVDVLSHTLGFLSDDVYRFEFRDYKMPETKERYFDFGPDDTFAPASVIMFSGGLDSFAGAIEELVERRSNVALVSQHSSTKIGKVQADLVRALARRVGRDKLMHIPVTVQLKHGTNIERTHRTRSFLFAALGVATARIFGRSQITFFENGIVSINLPPVGQVVGARATRTTHPKVLDGFSRLFAMVFDEEYRVVNPYFWRTKTEIVQQIEHLGFGGLIRHTRSCADVRNLTRMHTHCGRCSQCIDRRFAVLSAGLEARDPGEAYNLDLLDGPRTRVQDREIALAYVRNARWFTFASQSQFFQRFGEISRATDHLEDPPEIAVERIVDLHKRHGFAVTRVMDDARKSSGGGTRDSDSLLALYGESQATDIAGSFSIALSTQPSDAKQQFWKIRLDWTRKQSHIVGVGAIKGAGYELLEYLGKIHMEALGLGLEPEEYPLATGEALAKHWQLAGSASVRRRVLRLRRDLEALCRNRGIRGTG